MSDDFDNIDVRYKWDTEEMKRSVQFSVTSNFIIVKLFCWRPQRTNWKHYDREKNIGTIYLEYDELVRTAFDTAIQTAFQMEKDDLQERTTMQQTTTQISWRDDDAIDIEDDF